MTQGGRDMMSDKKNAKGNEVVLFADKSWLILMWFCPHSRLYLISQLPSVENLQKSGTQMVGAPIEWDHVTYGKSHALAVAALAEDSPQSNWREIYRAVKKGPTDGRCRISEDD